MIREKLQEDIRQLRVVREPTQKQVEQLNNLTQMLESFDSTKNGLVLQFDNAIAFETKYQKAISEVALVEHPSGVTFFDSQLRNLLNEFETDNKNKEDKLVAMQIPPGSKGLFTV